MLPEVKAAAKAVGEDQTNDVRIRIEETQDVIPLLRLCRTGGRQEGVGGEERVVFIIMGVSLLTRPVFREVTACIEPAGVPARNNHRPPAG